MLGLLTPSISTKKLQEGPGERQPEGVGPGVSHRLADPPLTVVVMPGLHGLVLNEFVPVLLLVMSDILTLVGVQLTFEFQDPAAETGKTGNAIWARGRRSRTSATIEMPREESDLCVRFTPAF